MLCYAPFAGKDVPAPMKRVIVSLDSYNQANRALGKAVHSLVKTLRKFLELPYAHYDTLYPTAPVQDDFVNCAAFTFANIQFAVHHLFFSNRAVTCEDHKHVAEWYGPLNGVAARTWLGQVQDTRTSTCVIVRVCAWRE